MAGCPLLPRPGQNDHRLAQSKGILPEIENRELTDDLAQQFRAATFDSPPAALPISAVFGMRYLHALMQRWAASGLGIAKCLGTGTLAIYGRWGEWGFGRHIGLR